MCNFTKTNKTCFYQFGTVHNIEWPSEFCFAVVNKTVLVDNLLAINSIHKLSVSFINGSSPLLVK